VFANIPFAQTLLATHRQKQYLYSVLAGALANVALNLILIPLHGLPGAAAARMCSEVLVLALLYRYSSRVVHVGVMNRTKAIAGGCVVMACTLALVRSDHLLLNIVVGGAVYVAAILLLRGITPQEVSLVVRTVRGSSS
jgi:O-antigen/teichoic acid export membrane protein